MPTLGPWELLIVLMIVVVIFGAGRISEIGGALGRGIREFRTSTRDDNPSSTPVAAGTAAASTLPSATATTPLPAGTTTIPPAVENKCASCGTVNPAGQTFCGQCGNRMAKAA